MPASVDTPLFQHAANYSGREAKPMHPVYDARDIAKAIVRNAVRPQRDMEVDAFTDEAAPASTGNLF